MLIRGAGKIIIKVHCLPNPSSPPPKSIESLGWKQFIGENSKMFSTFFLVSAILGSIVHRAVGGPLDCISGPCVTVEGVGKLKLMLKKYPHPIPIELQSQYYPIPIPGKLQGSWEHTQWSHRRINQFMGIPFGETTAGEHR